MEQEPQGEILNNEIDFQVSSDGFQKFIEFEAKTSAQAEIGNQAIKIVVNQHNLNPTPHTQILGWQRWEIWNLSEEKVNSLIPAIQEEVRKIKEQEQEQEQE